MPREDDQMQKRREKRDALRKKREAEARRLKRTLALAAVVLALAAAGIFYLVSNNADDTAQAARPTVAATQAAETTAETSPLEQSPITTIHIKAAGDLNVTDTVVRSGLSVNGYSYANAFRDVAAVLADADLTVMNFEGNVCGSPYGSATTSAPGELLAGLRAAGVDLLQMANSCPLNNGLNGLVTTLQAIRAAGMEPVGAFASDAEFQESKGYTMVEVQGIKIAFVAFTKGMGGRALPTGAEDLVNLLYEDYATDYKTIDTAGIEAILKNVESERPDITIALVHWGSEYYDEISTSQERIVSLMQRRGVDVIIGTHPHTLHPIDYDEFTGSFVAYSLGDFFGDASRGATNYSIILDLEITKDASTGVTRVTDYSYTPIFTVLSGQSAGDYSYSRVMRIDTALSAYDGNFLDKVTTSCYDSMVYALQRIEERLAMPTESES